MRSDRGCVMNQNGEFRLQFAVQEGKFGRLRFSLMLNEFKSHRNGVENYEEFEYDNIISIYKPLMSYFRHDASCFICNRERN